MSLLASSGASTVSAAAGTTLTLGNLSITGPAVFGSAGHTGRGGGWGQLWTLPPTAPPPLSRWPLAPCAMAPRALESGAAALDTFTSQIASTTVTNAGATLMMSMTSSMEVKDLFGARVRWTLGTSAVTVLTVDAGTFSGVISGKGQLTTNSQLVLSGTNTYTGETTISAGVLQVGAGGMTGSITGNVNLTNNGELAFERRDSFTFAGNITGSGSVGFLGPGTLTLTGIGSNYSGGTFITDGVVSFNNANALGNGNVSLAAGTQLLGTANLTLGAMASISAGTGSSTVSAKPGTTLILTSVIMQDPAANAVVGSTGNTGVVQFNPTPAGVFSAVFTGATIDVAFGTLRNGGGLNLYTSGAVSTTVHAGATLDVHDNNLEVKDLEGAGAVTLGKSAATVLKVDVGTFSGVISGAGPVGEGDRRHPGAYRHEHLYRWDNHRRGASADRHWRDDRQHHRQRQTDGPGGLARLRPQRLFHLRRQYHRQRICHQIWRGAY